MRTKNEIDDLYVLDMCDFGAKVYLSLSNQTIIPRFNIMPCEVELLKRYMKEKHPTVPYSLTYPTGQKL